MKKILLSMVLCTTLLTSCGVSSYPLRGNYQPEKFMETTNSFDNVWENVIDFFALNNIPISTLEKNSGIIVATEIAIDESLVTIEDQFGKISNPNAWFVLPYSKNAVGGRVTCSFNVRVKEVDNKKISINVNVSNIKGQPLISWLNTMTLKKEIVLGAITTDCASTGKFEQDLMNLMK